MSVPFSNTHLRVPRGFGTILEGLAREVLRDQPEDIPTFAARYFEVLIKNREVSGMDPAEWAAKLEDRFYNNDAFKTIQIGAEKETAPEVTTSKDKSCEFQSEDESTLSAEPSTPSTTEPPVSEESNSTESTNNEEKGSNTEKRTVSDEISISEGTSVTDPQSEEPIEQKIPTITTLEQVDRPINEIDSEKVPEKNISEFHSNPADLMSPRGISNVDVCAQELGEADNVGNDQLGSALVDEEVVNTEEDEDTEVAEPSTLSTTEHRVSEESNSIESMDNEEKGSNTERRTVSDEISISEGTSVTDPRLDEPIEQKVPTITTLEQVDRPINEIDSENVPEKNISESHSNPADLMSPRGISNVDVCVQELGEADNVGKDQLGSALVDEEVVNAEEEEDTEVAEPMESFLHSHLANVNICATELEETEKTMEREIIQDPAHVVEGEKNLEETIVESSFSQYEINQGNQHEAEEHAQRIMEEETTVTEAFNEETNEGLAHNKGSLDDSCIPKEDSLVENSFEDIPKGQGISGVGEKPSALEASVEVLQNNIFEPEESKEFSGTTAHHNISDTEDHLKSEMEIVKNEINSEEEEMKSQHEVHDMIKDETDTGNLDLNETHNDEKEKCVTSDQLTAEAVQEIQPEKTDENNDIDNTDECKIEQNQVTEKEAQSHDPDFKDDEVAEVNDGDEEGICTESASGLENQVINDDKVDPSLSQVAQINTYVAGMEEESETFEESAQHQPQENEESQKTLVVSQPEELTGELTDSEEQEESIVLDKEETISIIQCAGYMDANYQEDERPVKCENQPSELTNKSDQEECSRPQEEEDIMDIPLDDPEANRAAAKIQAGFRGHMTRKKLKPEDKAEGEEVSSTGEVLNGSQGVSETGRSGAVEGDDTSVPEQ